MISHIIEMLQKAETGISPELDRALGRYELPLTWRKIIKHIVRWLRK